MSVRAGMEAMPVRVVSVGRYKGSQEAQWEAWVTHGVPKGTHPHPRWES